MGWFGNVAAVRKPRTGLKLLLASVVFQLIYRRSGQKTQDGIETIKRGGSIFGDDGRSGQKTQDGIETARSAPTASDSESSQRSENPGRD